MDEINSTETFVDDSESFNEVEDSMDAAIDADWDDDVSAEEAEESETDQSEETEAEDSTDESEPQEEKTEEPTEDKKEETADEWWKTMKVLGEVKEVASIDEAKALMQKGADYDRIRAERDALKAERGNVSDYEAFVKELAESSNVTPEALMETTRIRFEMAKDKSLTQEKAKELVQGRMAESKAKAEAEAKKQNDFHEFGLAHRDVTGEMIPAEVWKAYNEGKGTLLELYDRHVAETTEKQKAEEVAKENERLKAELEALKANTKNKNRSTGSTKSRGKAAELDAIDSDWYND